MSLDLTLICNKLKISWHRFPPSLYFLCRCQYKVDIITSILLYKLFLKAQMHNKYLIFRWLFLTIVKVCSLCRPRDSTIHDPQIIIFFSQPASLIHHKGAVLLVSVSGMTALHNESILRFLSLFKQHFYNSLKYTLSTLSIFCEILFDFLLIIKLLVLCLTKYTGSNKIRTCYM